jgi:N utilization substance protein A
MLIPGMTETMAQNIFQSGFGSFQSVATANLEDISTIPGYDDASKALKLVADAKSVVEKYEKEGIPVPVSPATQALASAGKVSSDAKSQADLRLKAELEKLENQNTSTATTVSEE